MAGVRAHSRHTTVTEATRWSPSYGVLRERLATDRGSIEAFAHKHLGNGRVALEATTNCWAVAGILESLCQQVVVSNPLRTRAIAEAKIKTDRVNALVLAQLLRSEYRGTCAIHNSLTAKFSVDTIIGNHSARCSLARSFAACCPHSRRSGEISITGSKPTAGGLWSRYRRDSGLLCYAALYIFPGPGSQRFRFD